MSYKENFKSFFPESIYLDWNHQEELIDLVYQNNWVPASDKIILIEKPGEGNMNFVVRVKTSSTSIIVKQSRPWVEKYPQIAAPVDRITVEAEFYAALSRDAFFLPYCPKLIGFDEKNFLLAMEDLGEGSDCTFIYQKKSTLEDSQFQDLVSFISHLHNSPIGDQDPFTENAELKKLNHIHIFYYPYLKENGFNLDTIQPGLQHVSMLFKTNPLLKERLKHLGEIYLEKSNTLVHGDYYPGSWLNSKSGIKVIDPEFSHFGHAEFDLGVMMAHLKMAQMQPDVLKINLERYQRPAGFDNELFLGFFGAEIMRRIIGLAQLPLDLSLDEKSELLDFAFQLITRRKTSIVS